MQDVAPEHAVCSWCCVHPAGTETGSVPPLWQGRPLVTLLRGWHVAALGRTGLCMCRA